MSHVILARELDRLGERPAYLLMHHPPFDMHTVFPVRQSHESPAYAVVLLAQDQVTVHFHDYLDKSWLEDDGGDGGESRM
ncbi:hypothetical protein PCA20602_03122 [Pandoraea capi]|uniref:Uncharacterized protein n=1 Tax=Pandoraea capi TaxID=2508286 RepID=A0ABY6W5E2_9BURK|nr:hypothetical protein [Pandoraea capi]VVE20607.1 hypothetical protein PCA20602_03122 [Pandoraea capi]